MKPVVKRPLTIKLVILYIMDRYHDPIPETALSAMMLDDIEVNYFDYRQSLAELDKYGYIHSFMEDGHEFHQLNVSGKELNEEMYRRVAYQLRCNISGYIKREKAKIAASKFFKCELVPQSDVDFGVKVTYTEADTEMISLSFFVGNREAAENLMGVMKSRKTLLFKEINRAISNVIDAPPDEH